MGLGLVGGVTGSSVYDTLDQLMAKRLAEQQYADKRKQQDVENQQRNRQLDIQSEAAQPKPTGPHAPYVVGGALVSPEGGVIYSAPDKPTPAKQPGVHVIGGNLVDDSGKVIFTAPKEPAAPKDVHPIQVAGPDGNPIWVRPEDAINKPAANAPRAPVGADRNTLNYFNRMLEAEKNARAVEDKVGTWDTTVSDAPGIPGFLENWLHSDAGQKYTQAQRMFTEARLRKESGAAIPENEFANDRRMNFRSSGDTPDTVKQKRAARLQTMRGIGNASGRAFQEYYGDGVTLDSLLKEFGDPQGGGGGTVKMKAPNGQVKDVPADQVDFYKSKGAAVIQ